MKVLSRLEQDGIICDPVSDADLRGLAMIAQIWGQVWYIRRMMSSFSQAYRRKICFEPDMSRAERYALSCYLNVKKGNRIQIQDVIGKVKYYMDVTLTERQVAKIREIAYDIRRGRRLDPRTKNKNIQENAE
jgi:hypothetical protein